jgi:hypothetical protein
MIGIDPVPKFPMGDMVITPGAIAGLDQISVKLAIARHASGDWGGLDEHDRTVNENSLRDGGTLVSIYKDSRGVKFYVITEYDRSRTTVLLPEEY